MLIKWPDILKRWSEKVQYTSRLHHSFNTEDMILFTKTRHRRHTLKQKPNQHNFWTLNLRIRMQPMRLLCPPHTTCALGQTQHCIGFLGNSLFFLENSFCGWSETHSTFTTMTLQKCWSFDLLNVFAERPIKIQRAHTSLNPSLLSFEFLSLSSLRKPHAGTSQCFSD